MNMTIKFKSVLMSGVMAFGLLGVSAMAQSVQQSKPVPPMAPVQPAPSQTPQPLQLPNQILEQMSGKMTEARPQLKAPNASFIQQLSFADLVEEVSPAVVSIRTEIAVPAKARMQIPPELERMLPEEFRGQLERGDKGNSEPRRAFGQGSGFCIDAEGHIVTNNHVIADATKITVVMNNGEEIEATLVGVDPSTDLAVIKVTPRAGMRYVRFAKDADLRVGDYVLAVGNPFGLGGSVTSGIVSALGREDRTRRTQYADFIQIDASINQGNSGGPTFDLRGNVVGVNTAIISPTGGNVGIGLAVPADVASDVVAQLIDSGTVTRGWLGVTIGDLNDLLAEAVGLDDTDGALVQSVQKGSPAFNAGFAEGDVVLWFDRKKIGSASSLTRVVGGLPPGKVAKAKVFRDGKMTMLTVTLAKRDPLSPKQAGEVIEEPAQLSEEMTLDLGVTFSSLTDEKRKKLGLEEDVQGVLVANVARNSDAADAGIQEGMVITRADNKPVTSPADIKKAVMAAKDRGKEAVLVRVQTRRQGSFFLALPVTDSNKG